MNQLIIPSKFDKFRSAVYRVMKWPYLVTGLICYSVILCLIALYLSTPPQYSSQMDLVLPGTGSSSSVSLDDMGQVVSQTTTPFSGGGFNPRVNYKQMLLSRNVLENASKRLSISMPDLGLPQVTLTEQTSIINVKLKGPSPKDAAEKSWALYEAMQEELNLLRADEVARRDESIKNVLTTYRARTNIARNQILDFQQRSLLVSGEQLDLLISQQADLRTEKHMLKSQLSNLTQYVSALSEQLKISPSLASLGLQLQSDPSFNGFLSELNAASASLVEYKATWGGKHPKVTAQQRRSDEAHQQLLSYVRQFSGVEAVELIYALTIKDSPRRAELFSQLINGMAQISGKTAELNSIERAVLSVSDELKVASREVAELDRLQREFDLAEAVFTSAAARLEANKADVFASYPVLQMLAEPNRKSTQTSPKLMFAAAAGIFGFLFITLGLIVLWQRNTLVNLILKKK